MYLSEIDSVGIADAGGGKGSIGIVVVCYVKLV